MPRPSHFLDFDCDTVSDQKKTGCGKAMQGIRSACIVTLQCTQLTVYSGFTIVQTITHSTYSKSWLIHVWQWFILHMLSLPEVRPPGQIVLHLYNIQHAVILLWWAISELYSKFPPSNAARTYLASWLLYLNNIFFSLLSWYAALSLNECQSAEQNFNYLLNYLERWLISMSCT